ncbi:MAG: acyclic terpene utilization AtuA family protein [Acidimicrobiia bacterium]
MAGTLRIGSGSAWWGDRVEPAKLNAERGALDYLCFETMAEASATTAQVRKRRDPSFPGYDTYLDDRLSAVLPGCLANGTKIVSNQGWVNPIAAAERTVEHLRRLGARGIKVAAVTGSLVTDSIVDIGGPILETGASLTGLADSIVSAEAYLGADGIVAALAQGASIVMTGRVADPSLFLAPMMFEFGWRDDDWTRLGQGTGIGHLLECGAQVTGGYFADPGFKDVPNVWDLAFPIAEVDADGSAVITKVPGTGGAVTIRTVKEQMFYEVHDPAAYITPDVVVDFTTAIIGDLGDDRVRVSGIGGRPRTDSLKVTVGALEGWIGEDMFFYAGPGAVQRGELAKRVLEERFRIVGLVAEDVRIELLGIDALHGPIARRAGAPEPYEVAVRVAARTATREEANKVGREVDGMAVSGVGMTGKRVPFGERVREVVGIWSTLIPRSSATSTVTVMES